MELYLSLSREEIQSSIAYPMICEVRFGSRWETMRRKRRWLSEFTESERVAASELFKKSHEWYLVKGVPDSVRMKPSTLKLWQKLGDFCGSL